VGKQQKIARERFVLQHSYKSVLTLQANIIYPLDLTDCAKAKQLSIVVKEHLVCEMGTGSLRNLGKTI